MSSLLFSYAIFKVLLAFYTVADSPAQLIDSSTRSLIHQIFCSLRRKIWEFVAADLPTIFQKNPFWKMGLGQAIKQHKSFCSP